MNAVVSLKKDIPFHVPDITEAEINAVTEVMRGGWVNTGPKVQEFERRFSQYVASTNAVAVSSGTAALHVALRVLGIGPGEEVITTPYTFMATAQTVMHCMARPVLVEALPERDLIADLSFTRRKRRSNNHSEHRFAG